MATADMELAVETSPTVPENGAEKPEDNGRGKRARGDGEEKHEEESEEGNAKKHKVEEEASGGGENGGGGGDEKKKCTPVRLGSKEFGLSVEMFDYFHKLLQSWSVNFDINKYEHMVILDLLKRGHPEPNKKFGEGIQAFQVRYHPVWKNRCFFLVRVDGSVDDFSFRKCVDQILPLPDDMKYSDKGGGC